MIKRVISFGIFLFLSVGLFSQKTFEGTINYKISIIGEGAESMGPLMPNSMEIAVLKGDILVHIKGGLMESMLGQILTKTKTGKSYMIKEDEKTVYPLPADKPEDLNSKPTPTITKLNETLTINGYLCQKYKVVTTTDGAESITYTWNTEKFILPTTQKSGFSGLIQTNGAPGSALKIEVNQNGLQMIFEADKIDAEKPDKKLFVIPKGYKTGELGN